MDNRQKLTLWLEIIWWIVTGLVIFAVLYPIHRAGINWPFEAVNIGFVIALITFSRYIFLLPYTFIATRQEVKIALLLLMFPITFALAGAVNSFMTYVGEVTWDGITGHLLPEPKQAMESYLWSEMLFFGVGAALAAPAFAIRLFISVWRTRNRGTV